MSIDKVSLNRQFMYQPIIVKNDFPILTVASDFANTYGNQCKVFPSGNEIRIYSVNTTLRNEILKKLHNIGLRDFKIGKISCRFGKIRPPKI